MERGTNITDFKKTYRERNEGNFPDEMTIKLKKEWDLKYGENPAQHGAIYHLDSINAQNANTITHLTNLKSVRSDGKGKGGLSLTNTTDITRGMDCLKYFPDTPAMVMMKHNIISGFAKQTNEKQRPVDLFRLARDADRRSNFGCTLVTNRPLDKETAEAMLEIKGFFVDVLAAPEFSDGVIKFIEIKRREIRLAEFSSLDHLPRFYDDNTYGLRSIKEMPTGRIGIQDIYLTCIKGSKDLIFDPMIIDKEGIKHVIQHDPPADKIDDLLTAWWLNCSSVRSNGIVFVRDGVSVAIGSGQVERVGAVENAIIKGIQKAMDREEIEYDPLYGIQGYEKLNNNPFLGAVASSDAFFPFGDSVKLFNRAGAVAVIQPFGSNRDIQVIKTANECKIAMPATMERCFSHF